MNRIVVLEHAGGEGMGSLSAACTTIGVRARTIRAYAGEPVPRELAANEGLVILGGPEHVYDLDAAPYLREELQLIEVALKGNRPALGLCLGSQLLAHALGAPVYRSERELGWYDIHALPAAAADPLWRAVPSPLAASLWHDDAFALPAGAVALATSARTPVQAFRYGASTYGVLFHFEANRQHLDFMTAGDDDAHAALVEPSSHHLQLFTETAAAFFAGWLARR